MSEDDSELLELGIPLQLSGRGIGFTTGTPSLGQYATLLCQWRLPFALTQACRLALTVTVVLIVPLAARAGLGLRVTVAGGATLAGSLPVAGH